jgi:autophagy-related protein 2
MSVCCECCRPRDTLEPAVRIAFLAYENAPIAGETSENGDPPAVALEHRLYVRVLPVRVYLDEQVISFAKTLAVANAGPKKDTTAAVTKEGGKGSVGADEAASADPAEDLTTVATAPSGDKELYFQSILIAAMEIKIDYRASTVNIQALHHGDYLQLLNIFPLDGLEITLKHVKLNGVRGVPAFLQRVGEFWVKDIYANQLHRVISGTAPFRGLSNIGNDLHELLAIPLRDYRKTGGTLKHLRRSTQTLARTVTRETLHATQQLTMFVANAITELASDGPVVPPPGAHSNRTATPPARNSEPNRRTSQELAVAQGGDARNASHRRVSSEPAQQPSSVVEGLQMAYGSVTRELGAAAETVIAIPIREYVQTGPGGYLKSVIRALPIAILRPVAGVVEGVSYTMLGLRNDIDPAARLDEEDVWNIDIGTAFPGSPVRVAPSSHQVRGRK